VWVGDKEGRGGEEISEKKINSNQRREKRKDES